MSQLVARFLGELSFLDRLTLVGIHPNQELLL
jgi:hypothetical protein